MKTLIVYGTRYGCTRKCAELLRDCLSGEVHVRDAKAPLRSLKGYDAVCVGGAVYLGRLRKETVRFCTRHKKELLQKRLGLFACCYTPNGTDGFFETLFPRDLLVHAACVTAVGGEMNYERMNPLWRKLFQTLKKIDGFNEGFQEPQIDRAAIQALAEAVSR